MLLFASCSSLESLPPSRSHGDTAWLKLRIILQFALLKTHRQTRRPVIRGRSRVTSHRDHLLIGFYPELWCWPQDTGLTCGRGRNVRLRLFLSEDTYVQRLDHNLTFIFLPPWQKTAVLLCVQENVSDTYERKERKKKQIYSASRTKHCPLQFSFHVHYFCLRRHIILYFLITLHYNRQKDMP